MLDQPLAAAEVGDAGAGRGASRACTSAIAGNQAPPSSLMNIARFSVGDALAGVRAVVAVRRRRRRVRNASRQLRQRAEHPERLTGERGDVRGAVRVDQRRGVAGRQCVAALVGARGLVVDASSPVTAWCSSHSRM